MTQYFPLLCLLSYLISLERSASVDFISIVGGLEENKRGPFIHSHPLNLMTLFHVFYLFSFSMNCPDQLDKDACQSKCYFSLFYHIA